MYAVPKVSVVIPAHNYERFVGEAIQSVLSQTFTDLEVIVVDDGSTDCTRDVVHAFDDPRVHYIYQENRGLSSARNTGIQAASGRYIALDMVGDGPDRAKLMHLTEQFGLVDRIRWHGHVKFSQLPLFYSAADVFVFSGRSGGTPRVLLQAMACGVPVVASEIGGIVDHVDHGRTGLLFSNGCAEELAAQVKRALVDPETKSRLSHNAYAYAKSEVDWDALVKRIRNVYLTVAGLS